MRGERVADPILRAEADRRALELAAAIREAEGMDEGWDEGAGKFTMRVLWYRCHAPACIAGWALALNGEKPDLENPYDRAAELLGFPNQRAAAHLFSPLEGDRGCGRFGYDQFMEDEGWISPEHAAAALELLVAENEIDWERAKAMEEADGGG